jgi:hypothetical protein
VPAFHDALLFLAVLAILAGLLSTARAAHSE